MSRSFELIQSAQRWLNLGVSVVPVQPRSKACVIRWRAYESKPPTMAELRRWFYGGAANLAVVCGTGNLLVLDFDDLKQYISFIYRAGTLGKTYAEFTGRGAHLFYQVDEPKTERFNECEGLGLGHLCMVAPSVHPSGAIYQPALNPCLPVLQVKTNDLYSLLSKTKRPDYKRAKAGAVSTNNGTSLVSKIKATFDLFEYAKTITNLRPSGGAGRWWLGRCPLHGDNSPSLWIDTERATWGCYSPSCPGNRGGDVINLFALVNHVTVGEAILKLSRMANL